MIPGPSPSPEPFAPSSLMRSRAPSAEAAVGVMVIRVCSVPPSKSTCAGSNARSAAPSLMTFQSAVGVPLTGPRGVTSSGSTTGAPAVAQLRYVTLTIPLPLPSAVTWY